MTDHTILSRLLSKTALETLSKSYDKFNVTLKEDHHDSQTEVIIFNVPEDCFVIKIDDSFITPDSLFNCKNNECKRADYAIICPKEQCILFIELKRGKIVLREVVDQLKGADCVLSYIQQIGMSFWKEKSFLRNYKKRFIAIGNIKMHKKPIKGSRSTLVHDTPEKALKIEHPHRITFQEIASLNRD